MIMNISNGDSLLDCAAVVVAAVVVADEVFVVVFVFVTIVVVFSWTVELFWVVLLGSVDWLITIVVLFWVSVLVIVGLVTPLLVTVVSISETVVPLVVLVNVFGLEVCSSGPVVIVSTLGYFSIQNLKQSIRSELLVWEVSRHVSVMHRSNASDPVTCCPFTRTWIAKRLVNLIFPKCIIQSTTKSHLYKCSAWIYHARFLLKCIVIAFRNIWWFLISMTFFARPDIQKK